MNTPTPLADEQPAPTLTLDRRRFVQGAGAAAGAAVLAGAVPAGAAQAALPAGASVFKPLPAAVRVLDTRSAANYSFQEVAPFQFRLTLAGQHGVPANASAVVATVAGVNADQPNFVSVFPAGGSIPVVSNLNLPAPFDINANLVTVKVGQGGAVDVYAFNPADVIFDLIGYYEPITGPVKAGRFVGLDAAQRVLDTRPAVVEAGQTIVVDLSGVVPADASSAVINLTATETAEPGFATVFPYSEETVPGTSSLNWSFTGATRASAVIVPVSKETGRLIKIYTLTQAALIVDVTGYFTGPGSNESQFGAFVPLDPVRILDTRAPEQRDPQAPGGVLWPEWTVEAAIPGDAGVHASSVLINLTADQTRGPGFLTVAPARQPLPGTSNVNWSFAGTTVPNHAITRITRIAGIQVFTLGSAVIADLGGYYLGNPLEPTVAPQGNPPPPPIDVPWTLTVPALNVQLTVVDGDPDWVTNHGMGWHWTGTGRLGEAANIGIFGHRTESTGAFYYLQYLVAGHEWWLDTTDGRRYVYVMTERHLTDWHNENILAAVRSTPAPSSSLIACTVGNDSTKTNYPDPWAPTSKLYRIITNGSLSHWHALW